MNQLQKDAVEIVRALLEDDGQMVLSRPQTPNVPVCARCETEHGPVDIPREHKSHSLCKRHMLQQYYSFLDAFAENPKAHNPAKVQEITLKVRELENRPENTFPPDLSKQQQESLDVTPVCGECAKRYGLPPAQPGKRFSHGLCKRHSKLFCGDYPDDIAELDAMPDSAFAPDMAENQPPIFAP